MRLILLITLAALLSLGMGGCINDDISTSSSDILAFSRDTVNFDTVFTGEGTPTARLIVFNRSKKGVMISSIGLREPDSKFSINVDGVSGERFKDVEIRGNDSIYIFIECRIEEGEGNEPVLTSDDLDFVTNGVAQSVRLEAYGQNVERLRGKIVTDRMTMTAEIPYVVYDSLVVEKGGELRIEPGARVLFHDGAYIRVNGRIEAVGEAGKMIQLRGDRLDDVLPDVGYDILAGQWGGIRIGAESFGNRLEYVDMRSTEFGLVADSCAAGRERKLLLRNSWLHNSEGNVLKGNNAVIDAYGCCFSEAAGSVVSLRGGECRFVQCTVSNYYLFSAIGGALVDLKHVKPEDRESSSDPLMKGEFENCIFYGMPSSISPGDLTGADVFLRYVLLKENGNDDDNFLNCIWGEDPLFLTRREDYYFNYHLEEDSPVRHSGNPAFVGVETQEDMDGVNRLSGGESPALGAYAN